MASSGWRWRLGISVTMLLMATMQLYSSCAASDAPCPCSPPCTTDHEAVENIVTQLIAATATNVALKQQLLRLQHHKPLGVALRVNVTLWQLLSALLLLIVATGSYQVHQTRSHRAELQRQVQHLQQLLVQSSDTLQQQHAQHLEQEQLQALWASTLQDMIRLVRERAHALAEQEALLQKAVCLESGQEMVCDLASKQYGHDQQDQHGVAEQDDITCTAKAGYDDDSRPQVALGFCGLQQQDGVDVNQCVSEAAALDSRSPAEVVGAAGAAEGSNQGEQQPQLQGHALVVQLSLTALHSYMQSSFNAKVAGLQQLQHFVQQLEDELAKKAVIEAQDSARQLQHTPFARENLKQAKHKSAPAAHYTAHDEPAKQQQAQKAQKAASSADGLSTEEPQLKTAQGPVTSSKSMERPLSARHGTKPGMADRLKCCFAVKPATLSSSSDEDTAW